MSQAISAGLSAAAQYNQEREKKGDALGEPEANG